MKHPFTFQLSSMELLGIKNHEVSSLVLMGVIDIPTPIQ